MPETALLHYLDANICCQVKARTANQLNVGSSIHPNALGPCNKGVAFRSNHG